MSMTRKMVQLMIVCGGLWFSSNVYATEGVLPIGRSKVTEAKTPTKQVEEAKAQANTTTQPAIQFAEDEYVRITQPLTETEDGIRTFDSEINIMGEARMDTVIEIVSYTKDPAKPVVKLEDNPNYTEYKAKTVGATQTFNQLIKLEEGENHIIIYYTYKADGIERSIKFMMTRESQEIKKQIKDYIVTDPKGILNQIPQ